jgi:hypothetical protein
VNIVSRFIWLVTGVVWAARSLLEVAHPDYWDPITALDWSAIWVYSAAWLLMAPSVLLLGRLASSRRVLTAATVVAIGAVLAGGANAVEDGFGVTSLGTLYVIGFFTAWLAFVPLAVTLWRAGYRRLGRAVAAIFLGVTLFVIGGGLIILAVLGGIAVAPRWFTVTGEGAGSEPARAVGEGSVG